MHVFFHNDLDGRCSGHVIHDALSRDIIAGDDYEPQYHPIQYSDKFPIKKIRKDETVYIVDFSIQVEDMKALLERTKNVVWIDHHKTAIAKYVDFENIQGVREDGTAGCVLTYMWCHGAAIGEVPEYILLIGDRDVWKFDYGQRTRDFCMGIGTLDLSPMSKDWEKVKLATDHYVEIGSHVNAYLGNWYKSYAKSWGYEVDFEGRRCYVVNGKFPADAFDPITKRYAIAISTVWNGDSWTVTLYSRNGVDVSKIAKRFGEKYGTTGGGHHGAAGAVIPEIPFKKIQKAQE